MVNSCQAYKGNEAELRMQKQPHLYLILLRIA